MATILRVNIAEGVTLARREITFTSILEAKEFEPKIIVKIGDHTKIATPIDHSHQRHAITSRILQVHPLPSVVRLSSHGQVAYRQKLRQILRQIVRRRGSKNVSRLHAIQLITNVLHVLHVPS